jgi:hypothetical protein
MYKVTKYPGKYASIVLYKQLTVTSNNVCKTLETSSHAIEEGGVMGQVHSVDRWIDGNRWMG